VQYSLNSKVALIFKSLTVCASIIRLLHALVKWNEGSNAEIEVFTFTVIFPAVLIFSLVEMKTAQTKEGVLMRFGTLVQLLLIICIPPFSLYLALGMPVVFLVVELFVTRIPNNISSSIERFILK